MERRARGKNGLDSSRKCATESKTPGLAVRRYAPLPSGRERLSGARPRAPSTAAGRIRLGRSLRSGRFPRLLRFVHGHRQTQEAQAIGGIPSRALLPSL